ncbi:MAG: hypothetical protein AAFY64_04155, partial [Pseudomonadota bacterium]
ASTLALTPTNAPGSSSVWSQVPFAPRRLDGLAVAVDMRVRQLDIAAGNRLLDATLKFEAGPKQIAINRLSAKTPLNGDLSSNLILTAVSAGYRLDGDVRLSALDLARFSARGAASSPQSANATTGRAELNMKFRGEGLSPRALVGLLEGRGQIKLSDVTADGIAPKAVRRTADSVIAAGSPDKPTAVEREALMAALRTELARDALVIGSQSLGVTLRDGVLLIPRFHVRKPDGVASNVTTVDLSSLSTESRWRLAADKAQNETRPLPPVELIYTGPLATVGQIEPVIEVDGLARELVVRRMEKNVAELERLRREDEARVESERRARESAAERQREELERARREAAEARERESERRGRRSENGSELIPDLGSGSAPVLRRPLPNARGGARQGQLRRSAPSRSASGWTEQTKVRANN